MATGEAALTGESVPIDKTTEPIPVKDGMDADQVPLGDRKNMSYSGKCMLGRNLLTYLSLLFIVPQF
jgi:magnesium-transporting ATPase (P-type)